ncbi:MAG: hypothetical protein ABII79_05070 [bacterium]
MKVIKVLFIGIGSIIAFWLILIIVVAIFIELDSNETTKTSTIQDGAPAQSASSTVEKTSGKSGSSAKAETSTLKWRIIEKRDVSHGAAERITYWVRLKDDYNRDEIRKVITHITNKYKTHYDIIWLRIIPPDAKRRGEDWVGWTPEICKTKWISPSLDKQWHTTGDCMGTIDEHLGRIAIDWSDVRDVSDRPLTASVQDLPVLEDVAKEKDVADNSSVKASGSTKHILPFDPDEIVKQLKSSEFYAHADSIIWERETNLLGTSWWHGQTEHLSVHFRIVPDQLAVSILASTPDGMATALLTITALNRAAFPIDHDSITREIIPQLLKAAESNPSESQATTHNNLGLEVAKTPTGLLAYIITREPVFQKPSDFSPGTPEYTLANYIWTWKDQDWVAMVEHCQLTWRSNSNDPTDDLKVWLNFCTPVGFRIIDKEGGPAVVNISFTLKVDCQGLKKEKIKTARVIKERAPYKVSVDGLWGVNPYSFFP